MNSSAETFCPACGARGTSAFCPHDGTEMKLVGTEASTRPIPSGIEPYPPKAFPEASPRSASAPVSMRNRTKGLESGPLHRFLMPGEPVIQEYADVTSTGQFRAYLTDRRVLLVRRNAMEELHLNSIASMGFESRRHNGFLALGILLFAIGLVFTSFLLIGIPLGVLFVVAWYFATIHSIKVYGSGRQFEFYGNANSLQDFVRDVRLQQSKLGGNYQGFPQQTMLPPPPQVVQRSVEREVERQIVKVRCRHCGSLNLETDEMCEACHAPL